MREEMLRTVTDSLKWLVFKLDGRSVARLYDLHVVSEDTVRDLLNIVRGLRLENLNKNGINFPAVDLGDKTRKVSFQVTTEKEARKLQDSLDTFHGHNLDADYDHLFFLILGKKQKKYSTVKSPRIVFNPKEHVLDIDDLIREACALPDAQLVNVVAILKAAGLGVSKAHDSDAQAFKKLHAHFDRDAFKHHWHQEGSIAGFEAALTDLTELLSKGSVQGQRITKPIYQFGPEVENGLQAIKNALGQLRAAFNGCANSGEIQRDPQFACFRKRETADKINAAKLKVLEAVNKVGDQYALRPIMMNNPHE